MSKQPRTPARPGIAGLSRPSALLILLVALGAACPGAARAAVEDWAGKWDIRWPAGNARLTLQLDGTQAHGTYVPGNGVVDGTVTDRTLVGEYDDVLGSGTVKIELAGDGSSFFGHFSSGDWVTGEKVGDLDASAAFEADRSSPRAVLRSFLIAANNVRGGDLDYIQPAWDCLTTDSAVESVLPFHSQDLMMLYFDLVDRATFSLSTIPDSADSSRVRSQLQQAGTGELVEVDFVQRRDGWRLVVPPADQLEEAIAVLASHRPRPVDEHLEHLQLRHARATMRTFLEEYHRWGSGGRERVRSTMDLSGIRETLRDAEFPMLAAYLKETIDRVGYVILQEIPDDPEQPFPYVHFRHPRGDIVIAPTSIDDEVSWRFTPETLANIRGLYESLESVELASALIPQQEQLPYFYVSRLVRHHAPSLTTLRWGLEDWQWLALLTTVLLAILTAFLINAIAQALMRRSLQQHDVLSRKRLHVRLFLPLAITLAIAIGYVCAINIGLPMALFPAVHTTAVIVFTFGITWTAFNGATILQSYMRQAAERTSSYYDELLVSLLGSVAKSVIIVLGIAFLARGMGIPLGGLIAGLGVGGLAVAIAAKDTLANVFGSAVLLADRPFRRGDLVTASGQRGYVDSVGLRSTQIRTREGSVVSIPNSVLANEVIDNLGRRRSRRAKARISVTYDTPPDTLEAFADRLVERLQEHPSVNSATISAGVWELAESSIDLEFECFLDVMTIEGERRARHKLFTDIIRLADEMGVKFAFPTRTLHVSGSGEEKGPTAPTPDAPLSE